MNHYECTTLGFHLLIFQGPIDPKGFINYCIKFYKLSK